LDSQLCRKSSMDITVPFGLKARTPTSLPPAIEPVDRQAPVLTL
jgi:hypothetical protein